MSRQPLAGAQCGFHRCLRPLRQRQSRMPMWWKPSSSPRRCSCQTHWRQVHEKPEHRRPQKLHRRGARPTRADGNGWVQERKRRCRSIPRLRKRPRPAKDKQRQTANAVSLRPSASCLQHRNHHNKRQRNYQQTHQVSTRSSRGGAGRQRQSSPCR